jgi:hypothetical protein
MDSEDDLDDLDLGELNIDEDEDKEDKADEADEDDEDDEDDDLDLDLDLGDLEMDLGNLDLDDVHAQLESFSAKEHFQQQWSKLGAIGLFFQELLVAKEKIIIEEITEEHKRHAEQLRKDLGAKMASFGTNIVDVVFAKLDEERDVCEPYNPNVPHGYNRDQFFSLLAAFTKNNPIGTHVMEASWFSAREGNIRLQEVTRDELEDWWIGHTLDSHDPFHLDIPLRSEKDIRQELENETIHDLDDDLDDLDDDEIEIEVDFDSDLDDLEFEVEIEIDDDEIEDRASKKVNAVLDARKQINEEVAKQEAVQKKKKEYLLACEKAAKARQQVLDAELEAKVAVQELEGSFFSDDRTDGNIQKVQDASDHVTEMSQKVNAAKRKRSKNCQQRKRCKNQTERGAQAGQS